MPGFKHADDFLGALYETALIEHHLRDGEPPPGKVLTGSKEKTCIWFAARDLREEVQSVRGRIGSPELPEGSNYRYFSRRAHPEAWKLIVDWSCYVAARKEREQILIDTANTYKANGSIRAAAKAEGTPPATFRERLNAASAKGLLGFKPVMPGFEVVKVATTLDAEGAVEKEFVQQKREHGEKFEVPTGQIVKGVSALIDPEGREIIKWVKTQEDAEATLSLMRVTADALKEELPRILATKGPEHTSEFLLNQYTVTDLHFGMLAWAEETGSADYDLKIAEQLLLDWFSAAIATAPNAKIAILAQLGDLMHHDALESVTPAHKNVLDADSRLQKIIRVVIRVLRQVIAMLLERHPLVHIIMASANHDPASSAWLREWLLVMYENEPRITVDNSADIYYAYEWGRTALFYHHGHKSKLREVDSYFAGKFREMFGRAAHSYGHIGHYHRIEAIESNLMTVEQHRTLAPRDAHGNSKWLSGRDAKVITYHREFGEVGRNTLSPQMVQRAPM